MHCIAYLHKTRKSDYGVSFLDFPGCITAGRTLEEARQKQIEEIDRRAQAAGLSRSAYIVQAALRSRSKRAA